MGNTRVFLSALICCLTLLALNPLTFAQTSAENKFDYDAERKKALQLTEENKYADALPILEKLAATKPDDAVVLERLAVSVLVSASVKTKKDLLRVRSLAQRSRELGNNSSVVQMILENVPVDGNPDSFNANRKRTPAEEAVHLGEESFGKGELKTAIEHYERAAQLDPKLYNAPLFIGDTYLKMKEIDKAGEYFAKAIAIDPDRETAYRYWGDGLMKAGRMEESRAKFIEAVITAPYNNVTWQFLVEWARRNRKQLSHPRIEIPTSSVNRKDGKNIEIFVDPSKDGSEIETWMIYSISRAAWMTGKPFASAYPNEKEYRHSLREEAEALRLTAENVENHVKEGKLKENSLDISIANLLKLHRARLIEPYVLLAIPDEGITRDYAEYRKANRANLRKYMNEYVIVGN
jgi:tetratricopeptide (TPR) repeat protein